MMCSLISRNSNGPVENKSDYLESEENSNEEILNLLKLFDEIIKHIKNQKLNWICEMPA